MIINTRSFNQQKILKPKQTDIIIQCHAYKRNIKILYSSILFLLVPYMQHSGYIFCEIFKKTESKAIDSNRILKMNIVKIN